MQQHIPVALERCIALLTPAIEKSSNPVVIDATLGMGGHSKELLERFPNLKIIGFDRDLGAIEIAKKNLHATQERITIVHAVYDQISEVLGSMGISEVDGILFDLGVSSMQLDTPERGFAYSQDAPLDMRMDQSTGLSAQEVLDTYSRNDLVRVIRNYGEEKFATRVVDNIIAARETGKLKPAFQRPQEELVEIQQSAPSRRFELKLIKS